MLPDYAGGSLVNLMQSIRAGLGVGDGEVPASRLLDPSDVSSAHNVLFILIDGLGYQHFRDRPSPLLPYLRGSITSVFPSATASAITTVHTGCAPSRHAIVGRNMYLAETGVVTTFLPFRPRAPNSVFGNDVAIAPLIGGRPISAQLDLRTIQVIPKQLESSAYSSAMAGPAERWGAGTLGHWAKRTIDAVKCTPNRHYVYAYWAELDALSHAYGAASGAVRRHLRQIESAVERIASALTGSETLMIVTADHGFVDTDPSVVHRIEDHPVLAESLIRPLCGESRTAYCHVRSDRTQAFAAYAREHLGHAFDVYSGPELIESGWFGPGTPDGRLASRVGDWILVGRDRNLIRDALPGEPPWKNIGVHGGVSEDEMTVPLFVAEC